MADVSKITLPNGDKYNIKDVNRGVQLTVSVDSGAQSVSCADQAGNNIPILDIPTYLSHGATMYLIYGGDRYMFIGENYDWGQTSTSGTVNGTAYRFTKFNSLDKFVTVEVRINNADGSLYEITEITGDYAPIRSPTFTGTPRAPTPTSGDNSTQIATTAYVQDSVIKNIVDLADVDAANPSSGDVLVFRGASAVAGDLWISGDATYLGYDNYYSGLSATSVGDAIDELDARKSIISTTWDTIADSTQPTPNATRYTGKEIHCIANDVDTDYTDNNVSSTQYSGVYMQDGSKHNAGKCALNISTGGNIGLQLYAQDSYSSTVNSLTLNVAKDGSRSITVSDPTIWRNAIGYTAGSNVSVNNSTGVISAADTKATLKTATPSSFDTKTISNSPNWTNLGSYTFTPGLYLVIFSVRWGAKSAGYRKICFSETSTGGAVSNGHIVMGPASPSDITVQNLTFALNPTSNKTYYFNVSQYHSSTTTSIEAQGRYTIIQLA